MSVDTILIQAPQVNHCRIFADVSDFNCQVQCCRVSLRAASTELKCCKERENIFYNGRFNGFPATYVFADCAD